MKTAVALAKCSGYDFAEVESAVKRVMSELGGLPRFVSPGQTVLIKPNLLSDRTPDCAVTTHPQVVRALIRLIKQVGARPVMADSSAEAVKVGSVWEKTGYAKLSGEESVPLINLEHAGSKGFDVGGMRFSVAKPVLEADVVINVPKLKTHILTVITNAVKNMYGAMPGYQKAMLHKRYAHPARFGEFLAALYSTVPPALTLCDAVVGMHGDGPSGGDPVRLGFLAGSTDGVALDAVACKLLGVDMRIVPYFRRLRQLGVGESDLKNIDLIGDSPGSLSLPGFRLPNTWFRKLIPARLADLARPFVWIRPSFNERCSGCGLCAESCPVGALSMENGGRPKLKGELCIECCCCHEICPCKAVVMKHSQLVRLFLRDKFPV